MRPATVLLLSSDPRIAETIRTLVTATKDCELDWCAEPARGMECGGWRGPVGLLLLHVSRPTDVAWADDLLQQIPLRQPRLPVIVLCDNDQPDSRLRLLKRGAIDCLTRPLDLARLRFLIDILTVRSRYEVDPVSDSTGRDAAERRTSGSGYLFAGPRMARLQAQLRTVAARDTTILILGETGTGKTQLGRVVHELSPRRERPFLHVHCGALTPSLLESELFGHVRGAFTHADRDRVGKLAEAADGTLLLDEVDCIPLESQVKLLRAVEERVFEPVGSNRSVALRARLIAAANRPLERDVAEGHFRSDLYYRLNVVSFALPPLRERRELIRPLVRKFLEEFVASPGAGGEIRGISAEAWAVMEAYPWPGNIRELRNVVERAVALCPGRTIEVDDLPEILGGRRETEGVVVAAAAGAGGNGLAEARSTAELQRLTEALLRHHNNRTSAAAALGISRVTLYKKLRRYGLA